MNLKSLFRKRSKQLDDVRFHQGSYSHLRIKPPKNKQNIVVERNGPSFKKIFGKYRFRFSSLLLFPIFALVGGTTYLVFVSDLFNVTEVIVQGGIEEREIERLENAFINENALFLNVSGIEATIEDTVQYTDRIFVRKIYPNKIEINIEALKPELYYLDFQKYALLDTNLKIIELGSIPTPLDVTDVQRQLLQGELTIDSDYIQRRFIESLSEEEIADFDWKEVSVEEKEIIYNQVVLETELKIDEYFTLRSQFLKDNLGDYPILKFYEYAYEEDIDSKIGEIELSKEVIDKINRSLVDAAISDLRWINSIRLEIIISDGKKLIFGGINKSEIEDQIKRFNAVIKTEKYNEFSIFDFRTENFTGRN